jgi:hypothetical protein
MVRTRRTSAMSENWVILIPEDPRCVPPPDSQECARKRFWEIAPEADSIEIEIDDKITFVYCGENYERIVCPSCHSEIDYDWSRDTMVQDYEGGFRLEKYVTPCCGAAHTLHELAYEWPQGFGCFALSAKNARGPLGEEYRREFEQILGTPLRIIYRHM